MFSLNPYDGVIFILCYVIVIFRVLLKCQLAHFALQVMCIGG